MKHQVPSPRSRVDASPSANAGFTLPEVLISSTLFVLVISGVLSGHLFGLSMFRLTQTKLVATDAARKVTGKITSEIQNCKTTWIGDVKNGEFAARLDGEKQVGSGLLIYPTTNKSDFIIYFVNQADNTFRRTTGTPSSAIILAQSVTNTVVFRAQDYLGNVLTNNQNNRVIHLNL